MSEINIISQEIDKIYKTLLSLCSAQDLRESINNVSLINFSNGSKIYFDNGYPIKIEFHNDCVIDIHSPCLKGISNKEATIPEIHLPPPATTTEKV